MPPTLSPHQAQEACGLQARATSEEPATGQGSCQPARVCFSVPSVPHTYHTHPFLHTTHATCRPSTCNTHHTQHTPHIHHTRVLSHTRTCCMSFIHSMRATYTHGVVQIHKQHTRST